jgi:MFS family permease
MAEYFGQRGQGILGTQLMLTMAPVGMAVGGPVAGWIGARIGLRRQLLGGLALYGAAGLMALAVDRIEAFLLVRFILGFSSVNIDTAMTAILGARFSGARRARLIGIRSAVSSCGTLATVLLSGMIAQAGGWRAPFWMYMIAFPVAGMAWIAFRGARGREALAKPVAALSPAPFSILSLWPIYALTLLIGAAHTMPSFQMGFLLKEDGLSSPVNLSRVLALSSIIGIVGSFSFGWFYARLRRWTIAFAMALLSAGYSVIGVFHVIPIEIAGIVISGFGAGFTIPYMVARVLDRVTAEKRTQAIGFLLSSMFLGHFFNPIFVAPIRANLGNHAIFLVTGLLLGGGAAAIAAGILAARKPHPAEARAIKAAE